MNRAIVLKYINELRASYWFIPSLMVVGAIMLFLLTVLLDAQIDTEWMGNVPFLFSSRPEGARAVLSTVAGSMITVASVTFSLTLLAVSHANGQFGPRLLNNFMRDRQNQFTLGTFTATFIYCILVLQTVRSAEELPMGADSMEGLELTNAFVPQISILVALITALASVGVLVNFFHHVPESIRLSKVVSGIGRQMSNSIDDLFPEQIAFDKPDEVEKTSRELLPDDFFDNCKTVFKDANGFVQTIDDTGVIETAEEHDLIIHLALRPGDFYCSGRALMQVWPADRVTDDIREKLSYVVTIGVHRTITQNVLFAFDQLVEVAQRALSPGVNDPFSAIDCMNWLETGLVSLTQRKSPREFRYSEDGNLRVFARALKFADFCEAAFGQLRQYVAADRNASRHMIGSINNIRNSARNDSQREILDEHARLLIDAATANGMFEYDLEQLKELSKSGRDEEGQRFGAWIRQNDS